MTLEQYLNQKDASYMPTVNLIKGEYVEGYTAISKEGKYLTKVTIPKLNEKYKDFFNNEKIYYVREAGFPNLYTMDDMGNIKSTSCFRINS